MTRKLTAILAITSLFTNIALAGLPPTTTKSQLDSAKSTTFDFQAPFNQITKPSGTTALIETGNKNLLKDPGFESSDPTAVWVISGAGTVGRTSTTADVGSGSYALSYDAATTNGTVTSAAVAVPNGFIGKTLEASCDIKNTSAGLYKIQVYDGTNVLSEQLITTDSTYYVRNTLNFPAPTSGSISIRFLSGTAGEPVFYVDDCYLGLARNVGSTQLITEWTSWTPTGSWTTNTTYTGQWRRVGDQYEFRIRLALGGAPTATGLTVNFLSSACSAVDTSKNNGTTAPKYIGYGSIRSAGSDSAAIVAYTSGTAATIIVPNTASTYIASSTAVSNTLPATFTSGDAVEITGSVPCVGWTAQTTASIDAISKRGSIYFASGSSSVTSGSLTTFNAAAFGTNTLEGQALAPTTANDFGIRMTGAPAAMYEVIATGKFYASSAATTGTRTICEFRLYDGTNYSPSVYGIAPGGLSVESNDSVATITGLFPLSSAGTINVVMRGQRVSGNGTCYAEAGAYISIKNVSQPSPAIVLANSVSTTGTNGVKINSATISDAGVVSSETGDWINGSCAITDTSLFTCTLNSGIFSSAPSCSATRVSGDWVDRAITIGFTSMSQTSVVARTGYTDSATNYAKVAYGFSLICVGPR